MTVPAWLAPFSTGLVLLGCAAMAGCGPAGETPKLGSSSTQPEASASAPKSPRQPAGSATPSAIANAREGAVGKNASLLVKLGGTYLCDQRIYPAKPNPHITAWEWAFPNEPDDLADRLAAELPGSQRDGLGFHFTDAEGQIDIVVSVEAAGGTSKLGCGAPPAGTKSLVLASQR